MKTPKKWSKSNAYEMLAKFYEARGLKVQKISPPQSLEDNQ